MTVEIYRSTDSSAPVLTGQVGSLITLLDAVLVNGYGSKAAAGWTKAFSATNKAAYRMPALSGSPGESAQRYFRVDDDLSSTPYSAEVRMYDTMTSISVYDGTWGVPKIGSGSVYIRKSTSSDATARPWTIVASERGFYCFFTNGQTTYGSHSGSDFNGYFGDFITHVPGDSWNTALMGMDILAVSAFNTRFGKRDASGSFAGASGRLARSNAFGLTLGSGLSFTSRIGVDTSHIGAAVGASGTPYPDPVRGGLTLTRIEVTEQINNRYYVRGYMPGLWESESVGIPGTYYDTFDGSDSLSGYTFIVLPVYNSGSVGEAILEISNTWW